MTINKLTNNVKPLDEVDKINETIQLLNGEASFLNSIKSNFNESIKLEKNSGNTYAAVASRTDTNNMISFGIDSGGENRGIWDNKLNKWAFNIANDKAYVLGNEIAKKTDLLTKIDGDNNRLHAIKSYADKGEFLTDPEGLYCVNKYAHSTFDSSKFTIVGSPTITDDGIASGFSSSNYLTNAINITPINNLIITGKFIHSTVGNSSSTPDQQAIFSLGSQRYRVQTQANNSLKLLGNALTTVTINTPTLVNGDIIEFYVDIKEDEIEFSARVNGELYKVHSVQDIVFSDFNSITLGTILGATNYYLTGSIDLKQFSITVDGIPVFSGNKTGIDTVKADDYTVVGTPTISDDGIASGFSSGNLIIVPNITLGNNFEINYGFNIPTLSSNQCILAGQTGTYIQLTVYQNGNLGTDLGNGTTWITNASHATHIQTNQDYLLTLKVTNNILSVYLNNTLISSSTDVTGLNIPLTNLFVGTNRSASSFIDGSIDLNAFKIYVDGNLVYQPCLKIPYTESKTGSKIVDYIYRDRVNDMASQFGYAPYYTLQKDKKGNYQVVGSPTINGDFVVSGFSGSNCLKTNNTYDLGTITDWEFVSPIITIPAYTQSAQKYAYMLGTSVSDTNGACFCCLVETDGTLKFGIQKDSWGNYIVGSSIPKTQYSIGDTIQIKHTRNGNVFTTEYNLNNTGWTNKIEQTYTGTLNMNSVIWFGCYRSNGSPFIDGSLGLSKTYLKVNNKLAYEAVTDPNFTLPQVELYGYIEKRARDAAHPIGAPFYRLDNTIYDDEVRLEGAEVDKGLYLAIEQKLANYCTASVDNTKIILPNFIGKVPWGANDYGYISAGLPNITGTYRRSGDQRTNDALYSGCFYPYDNESYGKACHDSEGNYNGYQVLGVDASRSSSIYGNSTTVQPPAFKVRWLARYK